MKMATPIILSEVGFNSSGLQMLLDRWKLQEEKLQVFEETLKDVNKLMIYHPVHENLESNNSKMMLQQTLSILSDDDLSTSIQDGIYHTTSAQSITLSEDDFGHTLYKENYEEEEDTNMQNNESIEEFEKRIWKTVWKDEAFLNDNVVDGNCLHASKVSRTSLKNDLQRANSKMARLPIIALLRDDLQSTENFEGQELNLPSLFQQDFQGPHVTNLHLTSLSNDNFATTNFKDRPQSSKHMCLEDVGMFHNFGSFHQTKRISQEDLGILIDSKKILSLCEKVEPLEMNVNLVNPKLLSSSLSNEDLSNFNELSKQRASFVENIMASEAQRQMEREKEQLHRNEILKQEEEAIANIEKFLQNPLQLEQEEKHTFIKQKEYSRQQKIEELQRELDLSNANVKKLTENWNFFGKDTERRNIASQRIARAFKKKRCRMFNDCCTSIQKVVRGFLCRRRVQKLKGQRCKVMNVLNVAVEEGNLSMFIKSFADAQNIGLYKELDVLKLEFAQRMVAHLHVSNKEFQFEPSPQLQTLFMEAQSIGLEEEKFKELLQSREKSCDTALECLNQTMEVGNWKEYKSCRESALALGLEEEADILQERWEAAKVEVSGWLQQVASSWGIGRSVVFEKVKEAQRLGLITLAEEIQAIVSKKENDVLVGLKDSVMIGALKTFHEWLRIADFLNMKKVIKEYSSRFRQRITKVQKQLVQATLKNYEEKSMKQLLLEGSKLCLETEMAIVVKHIRQQIMIFIKEMINHIRQSISKGDNFLDQWRELHWQGKGVGIGESILKDLLQAIESGVILECKKIHRSIIAVFECDWMGFPIIYKLEIQKVFLNVKSLALEYNYISNSKACESTKKKGLKAGARLPLVKYCISWQEIEKLRGQWRHQSMQQYLKVLKPLKKLPRNLAITKPQKNKDATTEPRWMWQSTKGHDICTREGRKLDSEKNIEESVIVDCQNEDGNCDDEFWHTSHVQQYNHGLEVPSLATCILTRKLLEMSAHCNQMELHKIVKLNITHKDLTSLGVGILSRWCPKLRIFMIHKNKLSSLKGAFYGYEGMLEYILVKDNLLHDFKGLELLQNLKTLFIVGNLISYIGPTIEVQKDPKKFINATVETGRKMKTSFGDSDNCMSMPHTTCQSWQGTPRFLEDRNDPRVCLTFRNNHIQRTSTGLWPALKKLYLGNNRISRVWELGSLCPHLEVLDLGSNELVTLGGCEGQALAGLKNLRVLDVGQNKIKGHSLWKGLSHCPLLVFLVASRNRLTELPTHLGSVMLCEIWLNGNSITCLACKAWLPNLQRFYLQDNLIANLESLLGCPSLEVLDISFNHIVEFSQLNHLSSLRRLQILQMNDNPISNQKEHVERVLNVVPWLIELNNEHIDDSFRENSIQSIFLINMKIFGMQYLHEKAARAEKLFLSFENPKDVVRQWLNNNTNSSFTVWCPSSSLVLSTNHWANAKSKAMNRDIIEGMYGKAKRAILWTTLFDLYNIARTNPILKVELIPPRGSNLHPFQSLPCHYAREDNWNCLAFQEMLESHRKSHLWSKETSLRKEFLVQKDQFGPLTTDKGVKNFGNDIIADSLNIDQYIVDHMEYVDCKYQDIYKENVVYQMEIEVQLSKVRRLQAIARGMLVRKSRMRMKKLAIDVVKAREAQGLLERRRFLNGVLRIQVAWRRWIFWKAMKSATKLQAFWRGFLARKRFRQVLSRLQYVDDDDFEYIAVDENEFALDPIIFEDKYSLFCKRQPSENLNVENLYKLETWSKNSISKTKLVQEDYRPSLIDNHATCSTPNADKQGDVEDATLSSNQKNSSLQKNIIQCKETKVQTKPIKKTIDGCSCPHFSKRLKAPKLATNSLSDDASNFLLSNEAIVQSEDNRPLLKEVPPLTSDSCVHQYATKFDSKVKAHIFGKDFRAEKRKAAIAEIAKEWGFKDEKTVESYMKAKAKVQKMLEKKKNIHQGAESRFELFKAKSKGALVHSSPQFTYVKQIASRLPCKVEKETVPIPFEDTGLVDETLEHIHRPVALPALIPHIQQSHLKKGKLGKTCPTLVLPSKVF